MPQPTQSDLHVNALLTNFSIQFSQPEDGFVAEKVFPFVPVLKQSDRYAVYSRADFNRNVLRVLNRELDADFDPEDFDHVALFDPEHEWIEMRLRARREHTTLVRALDLPVHFEAGEEMRTEISAKFTAERLESDLAAAELELVRWFTDPDELFALTLSRAATDPAGGSLAAG